MDQNYRLSSLDFTLQQLCAIKAVCSIAEAAKREYLGEIRWTWCFEEDREFGKVVRKTATDMKERVEKLALPRRVADLMESIVVPIAQEMVFWKCQFPLLTVIWTSYGKVDRARSLADFLENGRPKSNYDRFVWASMICREESIMEIYNELSDEEIKLIQTNIYCGLYLPFECPPSQLPKFWLSVCRGVFGELVDGHRVPPQAYVRGLNAALDSQPGCADIAVSYFIDKLHSHEKIGGIVLTLRKFKSIQGYSPATLCKLFGEVSADLTLDQSIANFSASLLLLSLLDWPYQRFFLKAAQVLVARINPQNYFWTIRRLLKRVAGGYGDCNYKMLFFRFLEVCDTQGQSSHLYGHFSIDILRLIFSTDDVDILDFYLEGHSLHQRELLLRNSVQSISELISRRQFCLFEMFVRKCGVHSEELMVYVKDTISKIYPNNVDALRVVEIVEKILAEVRSDAAIAAV